MQDTTNKASRRGFFLTASVAGAAVASVSLIKSPTPVAAMQKCSSQHQLKVVVIC